MVRTVLKAQWHNGLLISARAAYFSTMPTRNRSVFQQSLDTYSERFVEMIQEEWQDRIREGTEYSTIDTTTSWRSVRSWLVEAYGNVSQLEIESFSQQTESQQIQLLQTLLTWFHCEFPYYHDICDACGASYKHDVDHTPESQEKLVKGTFLGYLYPNAHERQGSALQTELYNCHKCQQYTRFPRYNLASFVVGHGKGRCGEYSMLLFCMLRSLGQEVRWVVDWTDHVWVECRVGNACEEGRFVHLDPCEAVVDQPLLYQSWGKKTTYIMAFAVPPVLVVRELEWENGSTRLWLDDLQGNYDKYRLIEDVTLQYTEEGLENVQNRRVESCEQIQYAVDAVEGSLRQRLCELQPVR